MISQSLVKNIRISRILNETSCLKASSAVYTRAVDMLGFEGCVFIVFGSSKQEGGGANSSLAAYIRAQACDTVTSTSGTFYSLSGTTASSTMGHIDSSSKLGWTTGNLNRKVLVTDVYKPMSTHRHLRAIIVASSSDHLVGAIAIQYGPRRLGSSNVWRGSTRGGSTRWQSTQIGGQTVAATPSVTTATTK